MENALLFVGSMFFLSFIAGALYRIWYSNFFVRPSLSRTKASIEIDEHVIYLKHIASITEEYVHSSFLMMCGFLWGFFTYAMFFFFTDLPGSGLTENMMLSVLLTTTGGVLGGIFTLSRQLVIHDSSGTSHVLHLSDVERIELKQEITRDIMRLYEQDRPPREQ